jgi:hypothetical protein
MTRRGRVKGRQRDAAAIAALDQIRAYFAEAFRAARRRPTRRRRLR